MNCSVNIEDSKYLLFRILEKKEKTDVYEVVSKLHDNQLGIVKWYARWRQYAFFPNQDTVWNKDCLNDIRYFLEILMHDRKIARYHNSVVERTVNA